MSWSIMSTQGTQLNLRIKSSFSQYFLPIPFLVFSNYFWKLSCHQESSDMPINNNLAMCSSLILDHGIVTSNVWLNNSMCYISSSKSQETAELHLWMDFWKISKSIIESGNEVIEVHYVIFHCFNLVELLIFTVVCKDNILRTGNRMMQNILTCIPPTSISSDGFMIRFSIVTPWAVATSCMPLCAMVLAAMASSLVPISSITIAWGIWFSTASISTWLILNKRISTHSKCWTKKHASVQCTNKLVRWPS